MAYLEADCRDTRLPAGPFAGRVSRVFERACHLRTGGGDVIFVLARELGPGLRAVTVRAPEGFRFTDHVRPGAGMVQRSGQLRFEGRRLTVDLAPARPWSPAAVPASGRVRRDRVRVLARMRGAAHRTRFGWSDDASLKARTRALDIAGAVEILHRRVGLGPGLTPAGDDFIVGYLLGLRLVGNGSDGRRRFRTALERWTVGQTARTGDISAAYLVDAARGAFCDSLLALARAVVSDGDDGAALPGAAAEVLAQGHSSGAATLDGFLSAVESWSGR